MLASLRVAIRSALVSDRVQICICKRHITVPNCRSSVSEYIRQFGTPAAAQHRLLAYFTKYTFIRAWWKPCLIMQEEDHWSSCLLIGRYIKVLIRIWLSLRTRGKNYTRSKATSQNILGKHRQKTQGLNPHLNQRKNLMKCKLNSQIIVSTSAWNFRLLKRISQW